MREVLLGADPETATLTRRATDRLARARDELAGTVHPDGTITRRRRPALVDLGRVSRQRHPQRPDRSVQ
jgi:hypothetical protein